MMELVREILYIMNVCEMFDDPSKSVIQMLQMLKNACECRCESYVRVVCVVNGTRLQTMFLIFARPDNACDHCELAPGIAFVSPFASIFAYV